MLRATTTRIDISNFEDKIVPVVMSLVLLGSSGCATTGNEGGWTRVVASAKSSVSRKSVWIPLAAAAAFAATSADDEVSEWAIEHQPVFGSKENADDWAGRLSKGLVASALITSFAKRDDAYQPLTTDIWALGGAYAVTAGIKELAGRTRPDGVNDRAFPSSHATAAFAGATITTRNLSPPGSRYRPAVRAGLFTLATASAWARIESARHFPSDVLAGAAIGNFFAGMGNAFLASRENVSVTYAPTDDGGELRLQWLFR